MSTGQKTFTTVIRTLAHAFVGWQRRFQFDGTTFSCEDFTALWVYGDDAVWVNLKPEYKGPKPESGWVFLKTKAQSLRFLEQYFNTLN